MVVQFGYKHLLGHLPLCLEIRWVAYEFFIWKSLDGSQPDSQGFGTFMTLI